MRRITRDGCLDVVTGLVNRNELLEEINNKKRDVAKVL
jgi:hypothetical protein